MSDRLSFDEYGCFLAWSAKSRSVDPHTKVGGVAFDAQRRIIGAAYNGMKPGAQIPDWMSWEENRERKGNLMIHCESNLCSYIRRGECETIYLTLSPCHRCCQNIAALDIKRVVFLKEYAKDTFYKEFFTFHGLKEYFELPKEGKQKILRYIQDPANLSELVI
jgi:deoxycytidylate deaminase